MGVDCTRADANWKSFCEEFNIIIDELNENLDDVEMRMWIVSGVCGGVALILIVLLIALAIQLSSLRQKAIHAVGNPSAKPKRKPTPERGTSTKNGNNAESTHLRNPPPHSYAQPPKTMTSEEELAQMGFSAYTGHPVDPRGLSTSPVVNSSGGVRVLPSFPRNPPTGFRNTGAYNEGYM